MKKIIKYSSIVLVSSIISGTAIGTGIILSNQKSQNNQNIELNNVQTMNISSGLSNDDVTSDFKNSLNSNVTFNSIDPNNQFVNLHNPKANENFELRAQILYDSHEHSRNFDSFITNHYKTNTKLSSFNNNFTNYQFNDTLYNTMLSVYPNKNLYKDAVGWVDTTGFNGFSIDRKNIDISGYKNLDDYLNNNKNDSRFWYLDVNNKTYTKIWGIETDLNSDKIFFIGKQAPSPRAIAGDEWFQNKSYTYFQPSYINPESRQTWLWSVEDRSNGEITDWNGSKNNFHSDINKIKNEFYNRVNKIYSSNEKSIINSKFKLKTNSFLIKNQIPDSGDYRNCGTIMLTDTNSTQSYLRIYDNSVDSFQGNWTDQYWNYSRNFDYSKVDEFNGAKIGNFDTRNMLSQLNIDLSELINIDSNITDNETTNEGKVWTSAPKIQFGWNLDLLNSIKEAKKIGDIVYKIYQNFDKIYHFNGNQELAKNVNKLLNDIYFGKIGLNIINEYLDQLQNSNGTAMAYIASNNKNNSADYIVNAAKYGWNFGIANNNGNISFINTYSGKTNNKWNEIFDMSIIYNYVLPQIFQNNIYVDYTSTGSDVVNTVKIYDGNTCSWQPIYINDYGYQAEHLDNNVNVNIKNIYMKTVDNVLVAGTGSSNNSLNLSNVYNIATNSQLNSNIVSEQDNMNFNAKNELVFNFKYNSQFKNNNLGNNSITTIDKNKSLTSFNGTVSSIVGAWGFEPAIISQEEIRKQALLALPENVKNEWKIDENQDNNVYLDQVSQAQVVQDIGVDGNVSEETINAHPDLKTYYDILTTYNYYMGIATGTFSPPWGSDMTYYEARVKYYEYAYELDKLGYFYKTISFYKPIEYYIAPSKWEEYQNDDTFIENGTQDILGRTYYNYIVKFNANYKPIDKENLSKYIQISDVKSQIDEEATISEYNSQIEAINKSIIDSQVKIQLLKKQIVGLDSEIDYINSQMEILFNEYLNNNPELKAQYESVVESTDKNINEQIDIFEKAYNDFDSINDYVGSGVKQYLNKTFEYDGYLDNLLNVYKNKLDSLNSLFKTTGISDYILNQVTSLIDNVKGKINLLKDDLNNELSNLNNLNRQNLNLKQNIENINKLNYVDRLNISFNLEQMFKDTNNPWYKSRYYLCDESMFANFFYYFDSNDLGKILDQLILEKTGIVTHLGFNENLSFKFKDNFTNESEQKIWYESGYGSAWSQTYNMSYDEINNKLFININNINATILNSRSQMSDDVDRVKKQIDSINKKITSNSNLFNNNVNDINSYLLLLNNKTNDLNNINSENVIPVINQTNNNISDIQNAIDNYNDFVVSKSKWNAGVMAGIIIGSILGVGLLIGLIIYLSSLKRHKTKPIPKADKIALDKALAAQNK